MNFIQKMALTLGGCVAAILALWAAVSIFGLWFVVPGNRCLTVDQELLVKTGYTVLLFLGICFSAACLDLPFGKHGPKSVRCEAIENPRQTT
jgi:hypothetical protein